MPIQTQFEFIDRPDDLAAFCRELGQAPWMAIDTEFMRERTFYPDFCLLQVAMIDRVACIDPKALPTLDPLKILLNDPKLPKIVHSGRQDLELFFMLWGCLPANVFDTQIAVSFLGGPEQIGYARMVEDLFAVRLAKEHTRTDWSQRPLSIEQLRYAADDVIYLGAAYLELHRRLNDINRINWVREEVAALLDPALYRCKPEECWQRVAGIRYLPPRQFCTAQKLAAWREAKARELNIPRNWVLKDDVLCELAGQKPNTAMLPHIRGLDRLSQQRCTAEVRELINDAAPVGQEPVDLRPLHLDPASRNQMKMLAGIIQSKAKELNIPSSLLANRRDLELLLENPSASRVLSGWRLGVVGQDLLNVLPDIRTPPSSPHVI